MFVVNYLKFLLVEDFPMKRANMTGSIDKQKRNCRNPYRVRICTGEYTVDPDTLRVTPERFYLGSFPTRALAELSLASYLDAPYDINIRNMSFRDLYQLMMAESDFTADTQKYYRIPYNKLTMLYDKPFRNINLPAMQRMIMSTCTSKSQGDQMKSLFSIMSNFAIYYGIVDQNNCNVLKVPKVAEKPTRTPYSESEILTLFDHDNDPVVMSLLILILTGMRVDCEFLTLNSADIDFDQRLIRIRKSKTDAGIRYIPISKHITEYLHTLYDNHDYAFRPERGQKYADRPYAYNKYREKKFIPLKNQLNMENHIIYETRHTFATLSYRCGMQELTRKRIMGHSDKDLTNRVYTHTEYLDLINAVDLLDGYIDQLRAQRAPNDDIFVCDYE